MSTDSSQSQTTEYVRDNIVKVIDKNGRFYGTGFFIEVDDKKYCVTSHHCIYQLETIFLQKGVKIVPATWIEELSDMSKDITLLRTKEHIEAKPLLYNKQALRKLPVFLCGFAESELINFPEGRIVENCTLSRSVSLFHWPSKTSKGDRIWNQKPDVNVYVFQLENFFELGHSGSPVCYAQDNNVVGIFIARKEGKFGYVIPIQTLLEKFENTKNMSVPGPQKNLSVVIQGNDMYALNMMGNSLNSLGRHEEAIESLDRALAIDPNYVDALNNKGWALNGLSRYQEAIESLDRALAIDPNYVYALTNKGWALSDLSRYQEAIESLDRALAIDPNYVHALNNKGWAVYKLNKYEEAIKWYNKALAIYPSFVNARDNKKLAIEKLNARKSSRKK